MAVYVDPIFDHGVHVGSIRGRSCHMVADTPEELHQMARKLGLHRKWCSDYTQPDSTHLHYDLVPSRRDLAIRLGAIPMKREGMVEVLHNVAKQQRRGEAH